VTAKYAEAWPAWGYRKIAALMRADGHEVTNSSVARALRRRGLLLPQGFRADRKSWAVLRRKVFRDPPTGRNRVWQTDFSEFETSHGGIWRICAVIDYATKYCLAITVTPTARGADALACLQLAIAEAQRLLPLTTCAMIAASWTSSMPPKRSSATHRPRSPWSPTTGPAFAGTPSRPLSPVTTRCYVTYGPG
jgi:transposase InsO family protein